jgi:hypothetical protein
MPIYSWSNCGAECAGVIRILPRAFGIGSRSAPVVECVCDSRGVRMTNVHAAWRDFAAQDTDLSILKQHFANLFTLPLDGGSVRSNLAVGDARYRQEKCDGENGCRPIHLVRPFRDILISGFSVRALFVQLHRSRQGTSAGEERKSPGRDLLGYHQGRCPHMGSAEPRYQCGVRTFFGAGSRYGNHLQ